MAARAELTPARQPGIPPAATAKTQLAALTVKAAYDDGKYNRDLFPHWGTVSGTCNTRYDTRLHAFCI